MSKELNLTKGIFINNLEAVDIMNHIERERGFEMNYKGVLPYSLELIKLNTLDESSTKKYVNLDKNIYDRLVTDDVINVKFSCGQMNKQETIDYITKTTVKRVLHKQKYYKKKEAEYLNTMQCKYPKQYKKYKDTIDKILKDDVHMYNKTNAEDLRNKLYVDGFITKKTIYPALIKEHEKYNKEDADALKVKKKLLGEVEKDIKKTKNTIEKKKLKIKKEEIEKEIKLIFDSLEVEIIKTSYKMWKRSSSKSRTGQILYIKESLLQEMNNWGRMYLDLPTDEIIDVVGLSAYSSLVGSHIEGTLTIKPSNILIVSDVLSCFPINANVVRKEPIKKATLRKSTKLSNDKMKLIKTVVLESLKKDIKKKKNIITTIEKDKHLKVYEEETIIKSSLFDGQSLLDSSYFKEGQSMMLLRQNFFKSASFNCEVIQFLKDKYKDRYDTAEIKDMFGNRIRVNQVHMIVTPNSLKALKFSKYVKQDEEGKYIGTNNDMWKHWKKIVQNDSNVFGICKHEKESKQGADKNGNMIQQMSYQHINSLRADYESIKSLLDWEINYINSAKSDIEVYKDLLLKSSNFMNSNEMIAKLCDTNYVNTEMFRKQRAKIISKYVNKIKGGKVKIAGADNCVIIGNPYLMLLHSINELKGKLNDKDEFILDETFEDETLPISKDYIACNTKLFKDGDMLVTFRNPHTSSNNCGLSKNFRKENNLIDKYFNFSKNIIAVNLVRTEFQNIHSDSDQDSDFVLCSNNSSLVQIVKKSFRKDLVCINQIPNKPNKYKLTNKDMALMDNKLAQSKGIIGTVVNLGQLAMSEYYNTINTGIDKNNEVAVKRLKKLQEIVIVMTILSGCAIDNAKRTYDISMIDEINHVIKSGLITKKPIFWEYVSEAIKDKNDEIREKNKYKKYNEKVKLKTTQMQCPMEWVGQILSDKNNIPKAPDDTENEKKFADIIKDVDGKAKAEVSDYITKITKMLDDEISNYHAIKENDKEERRRQAIVLENVYEGIIQELKKRKVSEKNMQSILKKYIADEDSNIYYKTRLMNVLYTNNEEVFIGLFHKSN